MTTELGRAASLRRSKLIALTDAVKRAIDETLGRHVANERRILSPLLRSMNDSPHC